LETELFEDSSAKPNWSRRRRRAVAPLRPLLRLRPLCTPVYRGLSALAFVALTIAR